MVGFGGLGLILLLMIDIFLRYLYPTMSLGNSNTGTKVLGRPYLIHVVVDNNLINLPFCLLRYPLTL